MYYGFCMDGCKSDAKGGTHVSYVPKAIAAGAEIRPNCFALRIESAGGRATGVTYLEDGEERFQGAELMEVLDEYSHWGLLATLGEVLPNPDNRVTLADERDDIGVPVARITFSYGDNDKAIIDAERELAVAGDGGGGRNAHPDQRGHAPHPRNSPDGQRPRQLGRRPRLSQPRRAEPVDLRRLRLPDRWRRQPEPHDRGDSDAHGASRTGALGVSVGADRRPE